MSIYSSYLEQYPCLLEKGYGFSFFPENGIKETEKKFDEKIAHTIKNIAYDFLNTQPDNVFLLYHCEATDGRQKARHALYNKWYNSFDGKDKTCKQGLEVEIKTEMGETIYHYIGFIAKSSNKEIDNAIEELEQFAVDLIQMNSNKERSV